MIGIRATRMRQRANAQVPRRRPFVWLHAGTDPAATALTRSADRRGSILVSVLWIMIFLGFLAVILRVQMTGVVASVRITEDKASARILAEAGLSRAAAEIRAGPPDDAVALNDRLSSTIMLPAGTAVVSVTNEALRIDLNSAERPLIVGALRAAGAAPSTADSLATRIIERRGGQVPTDQSGNNPRLFQTVYELAALPGMTSAVALAVEPYVTVSSGLSGVRLEMLDDRLLGEIPGLPPSLRQAIRDFHARRLSRQQLDQALSQVTYNAPQQSSAGVSSSRRHSIPDIANLSRP